MAPVKSLHVGVFLPSPAGVRQGAQLLDTACVDIFGILSRDYLEAIAPLVPDQSLIALAPDVTISYIGVQPAGTLIPLTSGVRLPLTHHYADAAVAPGRLDVVLVPGPDPREAWEDGALAWLRRQGAVDSGADVLSVCTGAYVCARAGLLAAGRRACGPRSMQADLRRSFEGVVWVGDERRWERDGNFWSSGGVTNGNDLVAAYCRESGRFASPLVEVALAMTDVGDRPQLYDTKEQ